MPEYVNPWPHTVELIGPSGERIRLKGKSKKYLDEYYDRYADRGYIERVQSEPVAEAAISPNTKHTINTPVNHIKVGTPPKPQQQTVSSRRVRTQRTTPIRTPQPKPPQAPRVYEKPQSAPPAAHQGSEIMPTAKGLRRQPAASRPPVVKRPSIANITTKRKPGNKRLVGRVISGDALQIYKENSAHAPYRISNGVAIGVMSYNRPQSLIRFVESVKRTVDLDRVTLFVSDDGSTDNATQTALANIAQDARIVVLRNSTNLGIAGNSNRLLRCLSRFDHFFLCNDDVEFIQPGWIEFYIRGARQSNFHHFCFRQPNIYSAKLGEERTFAGVRMNMVNDKPHGAMLYMTNECLKKIFT